MQRLREDIHALTCQANLKGVSSTLSRSHGPSHNYPDSLKELASNSKSGKGWGGWGSFAGNSAGKVNSLQSQDTSSKDFRGSACNEPNAALKVLDEVDSTFEPQADNEPAENVAMTTPVKMNGQVEPSVLRVFCSC